MIELAGGMGYRQPNASFTGPCTTPWNRRAWSGGSSSRLGRRGRRGPRAVRHRLGDVGLHPVARRQLRRHRAPADLRPREPPRRDGALLDARQAGPARPHRRRLRPRPGGHRRRGPRRSDHRRAPVPLRGGRRPASASASASSRARATAASADMLAAFDQSLAVLRELGHGRGDGAARSAVGGGHANHPPGGGGERLRGPHRERRHRGAHGARGSLRCRTRATRSSPRTTSRPCASAA